MSYYPTKSKLLFEMLVGIPLSLVMMFSFFTHRDGLPCETFSYRFITRPVVELVLVERRRECGVRGGYSLILPEPPCVHDVALLKLEGISTSFFLPSYRQPESLEKLRRVMDSSGGLVGRKMTVAMGTVGTDQQVKAIWEENTFEKNRDPEFRIWGAVLEGRPIFSAREGCAEEQWYRKKTRILSIVWGFASLGLFIFLIFYARRHWHHTFRKKLL